MTLSRAQTDDAVRRIRRLCESGLDSISLRAEVVRRLAPIVLHSGYSFCTTDPGTGLITHGMTAGFPERTMRVYPDLVYLDRSTRHIDRARREQTVEVDGPPLLHEMIWADRPGHELNVILHSRDGLWGDLCLLREATSGGFTEPEIRFIRRIAPHLARGLRAAHLMDPAGVQSPGTAADGPGRGGPGVVVLDERGDQSLRTAAAAAYLQDLADVGLPAGATPSALRSTICLNHAPRPPGAGGITKHPESRALRTRGRSGACYTLRACIAEPDATGRASTIVIIEPTAAHEIAPIATRMYRLSPREREVVALVARGESTKCIAARLGLSPYTVQEHLGSACGKVGVRGRRALVAYLFLDAGGVRG